jgi:hypothetical protein
VTPGVATAAPGGAVGATPMLEAPRVPAAAVGASSAVGGTASAAGGAAAVTIRGGRDR